MKYQAEILLLKNKFRLMKGTIRHGWQGIIGIVAVGSIFFYQFFFVIAKAGYGTAASSEGVFYALLFVVAINLYRVFINQSPVFRIEAASVLHTYNTSLFRKSLFRKQILSMFSSLLVSGIFAYILSGFIFNLSFLKMWFSFSLYNSNSTFLSWLFYHKKGKSRWIVLVIFSLCTVGLFLKSAPATVVLAIFLCAVWAYAQWYLRMDMPKYFERLQRNEAASVAFSQNDYARMVQIAEENRPAFVRGPMIYHLRLTKKTALWGKSMLELFRMQKQPIILLALLMLTGWLVSQTSLLSFLPLLDDPAISRVFAVFCTTTALCSFYQLLIKQAKTVSEKRRLGLSLPYSTKQIVTSYGLTAVSLNLLITIAISLVYSVFSMRLVLFFFSETIAYFVPCCSQLYETRFQRAANTLSNMLLLAGVGFLLAG
ncbi:MAG: hypothetical protein IJK77_03790 [Lachnospiraceae bacterium]|nr:hypothetical protein [Lachnospiraceae bacterium]